MDDLRQQHGNHTWDIVIHYYRCPSCGFIIENRDKYKREFHHLTKEIDCARCHKKFTVNKMIKPTFGPLLGHDD